MIDTVHCHGGGLPRPAAALPVPTGSLQPRAPSVKSLPTSLTGWSASTASYEADRNPQQMKAARSVTITALVYPDIDWHRIQR